ncbi:apolipoprotein N-acyltransferase [Actinocrispum wychmicini]|uniref:apolipoprotein N-acyltransferase n=1 Tax=Actinocrispum wychmicini TaxID=1213861 RepID=UPI001FB7F333|nr:apolipoprotein N-acyltransferase [Actinocrispum wychmicini]
MIETAVSPQPRRVPHGRRRFVPSRPTVWRLVLAAGAGGLLFASFPPRPLWWVAPVAFAVFAGVIHGRRARAGFGYGLVFGLAFTLPELYWLQHFLGADFGPTPWLALSAAVAVLMALPAAGMAVVSTLPGGPVWMAMLFVAGEAIRGRFPFGGFPWARVGFGQPEGLYLPLASVAGAPLLTFAVVLTGCAIAVVVIRRRVRYAVVAVVPLVAGAALWPTIGTDAQAGSLTVAVVQGNGPQGLAGLGSGAGTTMRRNHLERAAALADDIQHGRVPKPDVVVMPETFTALGADPAADREISKVVADLGVPTLVGARIRHADGTEQNVVIVWDPKTGPGQMYAKSKLVPFGEFFPLRPVARIFTPFADQEVDLTPGTQQPVLDMAGVRMGVAICFEVAYDDVLNAAAAQGAQVLLVPTNNAWYGPGEMSYQQLAMSRVRAVELGRAVVVSATTGVSAIVRPDGSVTRQTELYTPDTLVATVPKRTTVTLATRIGAWPEGAMVVGGLAAVLWAVGGRVRRRRADSSRDEE